MTRCTSSQVGLSAVIPTWRRPHLLAEVLEPLLSDTTVEEIIVVDDGSGDTTVEVCEQLAATAPKLRLIQQRN
ncbi:MAG: glycosyltransferase, partial [Actinomycetota bacterium]|nr:glycosyltransferase [Actinomycetota bacterium]